MSTRSRAPRRVGPFTNISRGPGAWSVKLMRRGQGRADYFPDAVWGGRRESLVAARRFRDELLLRIEPDTRVRREAPPGKRGITNLVGVSLERHVVDGRVYERYVAHWTDAEGLRQRRRFLVQHRGRDKALALAIEARTNGVSQAYAAHLARQREEARQRLSRAAPMPRQVKHPLSRKGISMARRKPRRVG